MCFCSYFKRWNRLHRMQKTIILVIALVSVFYIFSHFEFHRNTKQKISDKHEHEPIRKPQIDQEIIRRPIAEKEKVRLSLILFSIDFKLNSFSCFSLYLPNHQIVLKKAFNSKDQQMSAKKK